MVEFARHVTLKMLWAQAREGWSPSPGTFF